KCNVNRAAMSFRPVGQCRDRLNAKQLVIGELEKSFAVIFTHRSKTEGFGIKSLRALQVGRFQDHVAEANIAKRLAVHTDFYMVVVKIGEAKGAPERRAALMGTGFSADDPRLFDALNDGVEIFLLANRDPITGRNAGRSLCLNARQVQADDIVAGLDVSMPRRAVGIFALRQK